MPRPLPVRRLAARAALLVALPAALGAQRPTYTSVTFFGDSYVDTGNNFFATGGGNPAAPYFNGRYSNGPIWVDVLAQALGRPQDAQAQVRPGGFGASGNYAFGGARTVDVPLGGGNFIPGTGTQINLYRTIGGTGLRSADPTGLYALFIGGNDMSAASGIADPAARQAAITAAGNAVVSQAQTLVAAGARNVLVFTLPSLARVPGSLANPGAAPLLDQLALTFNSTVAAGLAGLQPNLPGGTSILNFRFDNLFANILLDAAQGGVRYGITNPTVPCLFAPVGVTPPSCDVSLFVDGIHPSARAHQLIGNSVATFVTTGQNVALIPEPGTVALVAGGLLAVAGAGAARRRRAA